MVYFLFLSYKFLKTTGHDHFSTFSRFSKFWFHELLTSLFIWMFSQYHREVNYDRKSYSLSFAHRLEWAKRNFNPNPVCSVCDYAEDINFLRKKFTYVSHSDHANRCIVVRLSLQCSCLLQFTVKKVALDFLLSIKRTKWRVINFMKTKQKCSRFYV